MRGAKSRVGLSITYLPNGDTVGRHWTFNMSGDFDQLFEKSAAVFAAPGPVDRARLIEIAREHGSEFV